MVNVRLMREFTLEELSMIRRHWMEDMSTFQLAKFFNCEQEDILAACRKMKLKIRNVHLVRFCTPFPPQIARQVKKFNWATHYGEISDGKDQAHSANPD